MVIDAQRGDLVTRHLEDGLEIGNGLVRARFRRRDGGYTQEFHAADESGEFRLVLSSLHKNLIPMSEHRACTSPMIAGDRPHLFAVCRESLRMVYSSVEVTHHDDRSVTAHLTGTVQGHDLLCSVTVSSGSNAVHVVARDRIEHSGPGPLVEYLMSSYAFLPDGRELKVGETVDYVWAPNLRPGDDHVIGDRAFHSTMAVVRKGSISAALAPDIDLLRDHRPMPCALDLDLSNGLLPAPLISYGFCGYETTSEGGYDRHDVTMARRIPGGELVYGYHLLLSADGGPGHAERMAAGFLWERHGASTMASARASSPRPEAVPLARGAVGRVAESVADIHTTARLIDGRKTLAKARKCFGAYRRSGNRRDLSAGVGLLDQMCLLQSVGVKPWIAEGGSPGILVSSNVGAIPDPELSARFARCAMDYGAATGNREYFERGCAALAAALSYPELGTEARASVERIAAAVASDYGSVFVHVAEKWGVHILPPGRIVVRLTRGAVSVDLNGHRNGSNSRMVFGGVRANSYRVTIGDTQRSCSRDEMERGIPLPRHEPEPTPEPEPAIGWRQLALDGLGM